MSELAYPLINGHAASWASIGLQIGGTEGTKLTGSQALRGFRAISYKSTLERSAVEGAGREVHAFTEGKLTHEASVTWIFETYDHLVQQLGDGFMDQGFVLSVSFRLGTNVIRNVQIIAKGMKETGGDFSQGTEGLEIPMPLDVLRILYDGKSPVKTTLL
ncbi:hypothetical protein [Sorangium sp. So ce388]|uniref:hypothetical protein n=1 Tax=Sorangium sp. So ce388 TaxID=3133309 RepID=UPI003F5BEC53